MAALRSFVLTLVLIGVVTTAGCSGLVGNHDVIRVDSPGGFASAQQFTRDGVAAVERGDFDVAVAAFKRAIRIDETYGPAHNNLGRVYFQRRDLQRAAKAFGWAIDFMPDRPEPMNNLAMVYEAAGKRNEAIELYQAAHELRPNEPEYLANLVRARILGGEDGDVIRSELQTLKFIEHRPEWLSWVERQLALASPDDSRTKNLDLDNAGYALDRDRTVPRDDEPVSDSIELELITPSNELVPLPPSVDSVEHF